MEQHQAKDKLHTNSMEVDIQYRWSYIDVSPANLPFKFECVLCADVFVCLWCQEIKVKGINWESEKDTVWWKWEKKNKYRKK